MGALALSLRSAAFGSLLSYLTGHVQKIYRCQFSVCRTRCMGSTNNLVSPIVKPIKRRGRAPSSYAHATLRGHTGSVFVKILMDIGLSRTHAHREVAKLLANLGVRAERGSGGLTAATVRNWCDEVSRDVGRHRPTAAQQYDFWIERPEEQRKFTETSKDEAKRYALASLTGWVQSLFPELRKAT